MRQLEHSEPRRSWEMLGSENVGPLPVVGRKCGNGKREKKVQALRSGVPEASDIKKPNNTD